MQDGDFPLPRLHPLLTLRRAPDNLDGKPAWTLHDPLSNEYFKIGWAEFECLSRFSRVTTAHALKTLVEQETTLRVDMDEIQTLCDFLRKRGLVALQEQSTPFTPKKPISWLKKALHGYLFFTVPLFRPNDFLKRTLPYVAPFLSRGFITAMLAVFVAAILMTVQRADQFVHTFTGLLSWDGALLIMAVFFGVKIVHEMAHAYTAVKYGVPVPHIGIAFMVMYPVLYTEVTGSYRLPTRTARLHIGMAGVMAELCVAALALLAWNMLPYGSAGQAVTFSIVAVSLVGSLLINLNPLMRFDGYYMLSDYTGFENLQARACAFARWKLRKILFSLNDSAPESLMPAQARFLTLFGTALIVYRFFLFLGIAVLVYHVFFKPLGAFLMAVELIWFIGLPIWHEMKIWWARRRDILATTRGKSVFVTVAAFFVLLFIPVTQVSQIPAVLHAGKYRSVFAPAPAQILEFHAIEGQVVKAGDILVRLDSPELTHETAVTRRKLENLEALRRRGTTQAETAAQMADIDAQIAQQRVTLAGLEERAVRLQVAAPFDGTIRDVSLSMTPGRFVGGEELLFRLIDETRLAVSGYAGEDDIARMGSGIAGVFYPEGDASHAVPLLLQSVAVADTGHLAWPELASVYGGPVPTQAPSGGGMPIPLTTLYNVHFTTVEGANPTAMAVRPGRVRMTLHDKSYMSLFFNKLISLWNREGGLL